MDSLFSVRTYMCRPSSPLLVLPRREPSESPSRTSATFVPFSWFTESRGSISSSGTPPCSPKIPPLGTQSPCKSHSQVGPSICASTFIVLCIFESFFCIHGQEREEREESRMEKRDVNCQYINSFVMSLNTFHLPRLPVL